MTVKHFTFNPFQTNCYVCHNEGEAVIIDPASYEPAERQAVLDYLEQHDLTVRHLLLTHAHIDHIFDCAFFSRHFGQAFQMHSEDRPLLSYAEEQARMFDVTVEPPPPPGRLLDEGDVIQFGSATWRVLHTPGHSPGSICFYDEENALVISGDVLFSGSIGRTDLWKGSLAVLMNSIFQKLIPLGDAVQVYPGHGPATWIGHERQSNPFLTESGFPSL